MRYSPSALVIVAALGLLLSAGVSAAPPGYAPLMPLASRSLLLDISAAGERLVVVGERGHVLYSDDRGHTWRQARVPTTAMLTSVYFRDARHGWAAGHDGLILASDDGGDNWRIQRDGLAVQYQANIESREAAHRNLERLALGLESASGEARAQLERELAEARIALEDADLTLQEEVFTAPLMDIWFQDDDRGWAVGAFGTLVFTGNGGQRWETLARELDNPDELHLNAITGDGGGRIFIAGEAGAMFRSLDGGQSWESLPPIYPGSWFGSVYDARHDTLLVFGLRGTLFRSTDFGTSWQPVSTGNIGSLAGGSCSASADIVLAGAGGTALSSSDGGRSFRVTTVADRLGLSSGLSVEGGLVLVGQGGVKRVEGSRHDR